MTFRRMASALALGGVLLGSVPAIAHDDPKPRHGGIVQLINDVAYELVVKGTHVEIHVADHGKPVSMAGTTGKLTVMMGTQRSEADLVAVGDRLEAKGVKLDKGAKVVAALTMPNRKAVTVRFAVK